MSKTILALNAGSSSIKFGLFGVTDAEPTYLFVGEVADIGDKPHLTVKDMEGKKRLDRGWLAPRKREDILDDILSWVDQMRDPTDSPRSDIASCMADRNLLRRQSWIARLSTNWRS
jgi:acetate kinase